MHIPTLQYHINTRMRACTAHTSMRLHMKLVPNSQTCFETAGYIRNTSKSTVCVYRARSLLNSEIDIFHSRLTTNGMLSTPITNSGTKVMDKWRRKNVAAEWRSSFLTPMRDSAWLWRSTQAIFSLSAYFRHSNIFWCIIAPVQWTRASHIFSCSLEQPPLSLETRMTMRPRLRQTWWSSAYPWSLQIYWAMEDRLPPHLQLLGRMW